MTARNYYACYCAFLTCLLLMARIGLGQSAAYQSPDDIAFRPVTIISEGSRLGGETFVLKKNEGQSLPTIILCHGWGGIAERLRPEAVAFARAGYFAVSFDYRGWGKSEGRIVAAKSLA